MSTADRDRAMRMKKYARAAVVGTLAGALYGSWAVYVNWSHDLAHVARAGAMQFLLSFCSTSFLTLMIELVLTRGRKPANLVLAAVGPHASMVSVFLLAHWIAGTPNVLKTIAPSATVGLVFSILYVLKRRRAPADEPAPSRRDHLGHAGVREIAVVP